MDPTVFARCSGKCTRRGRGAEAGSYFGKAFTAKKFDRGPLCENCSAPMVELFRLRVD
jgi:hypothetical protein